MLITCPTCKHAYNANRPQCSACGTCTKSRTPLHREPTSHVCVVCDRPRATVECWDCGEWTHKKCAARHAGHHMDDLAAELDAFRVPSA